MKRLLLTMSCLLGVFCVQAAKIACEGDCLYHLQGVASDGNALYWSFTDTIVKTDRGGKLIRRIPSDDHSGDLCVVSGKVYVAVNLGKFNTEDGADSWVYRYDAETLSFEKKWKVPELRHGAGGMTFADGDFYVIGGLPPDHMANYVYRYTPEFKFVDRYVLMTGYTGLGIQTAHFFGNQFYFGCYGGKDVNGKDVNECTLVCPKSLDGFKRNATCCDVGILDRDGILYRARTRRLENGRWCGWLQEFP